jgi:hypothetical protein
MFPQALQHYGSLLFGGHRPMLLASGDEQVAESIEPAVDDQAGRADEPSEDAVDLVVQEVRNAKVMGQGVRFPQRAVQLLGPPGGLAFPVGIHLIELLEQSLAVLLVGEASGTPFAGVDWCFAWCVACRFA